VSGQHEKDVTGAVGAKSLVAAGTANDCHRAASLSQVGSRRDPLLLPRTVRALPLSRPSTASYSGCRGLAGLAVPPGHRHAQALDKALGAGARILLRPTTAAVAAGTLVVLRDSSPVQAPATSWAASRGIAFGIRQGREPAVGPAARVTRADAHFIAASGPSLAPFVVHITEQAVVRLPGEAHAPLHPGALKVEPLAIESITLDSGKCEVHGSPA
jgi:hypothetical protein